MSAMTGTMPPPSSTPASPTSSRKTSALAASGGLEKEKEKEKRYKCQFCNRAFSRSEHRSRHERSRKSLHCACRKQMKTPKKKCLRVETLIAASTHTKKTNPCGLEGPPLHPSSPSIIIIIIIPRTSSHR